MPVENDWSLWMYDGNEMLSHTLYMLYVARFRNTAEATTAVCAWYCVCVCVTCVFALNGSKSDIYK